MSGDGCCIARPGGWVLD